MEKTFDFESRYGKAYKIKFVKAGYAYGGGLAVLVFDWDADFGWWEDYGCLTVNIMEPTDEGMAYLDTNNMPDLCAFVVNNGWAEIEEVGYSGFCTYPLVRFTDEFLDEICAEYEDGE